MRRDPVRHGSPAPPGELGDGADDEGSHDECAGPAPGVRVVPSSRIAAVPVPPAEEGVAG